MPNELRIYPGREKRFHFQWRQGPSASSPPLNTTGATCLVIQASLPNWVTINILDTSIGSYEAVFAGPPTVGMAPASQLLSVIIALTLPAGPGYSPDPIHIPIVLIG